jgi:TolA-binding protein
MTLKRLVNWTFLILSISLSGYFLYHMSKNPIVQAIAVIFAIMYELANKYIISAGRTAWKSKHVFNALLLFVFYGVYIVYNILSGAGFFITEIAIQDRAAAKAEIVETANRQKLDQLNRSIDTLNRALEVEVETSYRSRSAAITAELRQREAEREALLKTMASGPVEKAEDKNPFKDLAEALGLPMDKLVGVVWCMVMAGICVILIVTSEDLPEKKQVTSSVTHNSSAGNSNTPKRAVTLHRHIETTGELCICGCGQPRSGNSMYYSNACKTRMSRRNKAEGVG